MDGLHVPQDKPMPEYSLYGDDFDDPALKNTLGYWLSKQPATEPEARTGHLTGGLNMDGSHFPSDMRYVLLDRKIADLIDDLQPDDLQFLVELITSLRDCECGCRGRSHVTISTDGRRVARLVGRLRQRGPAVPDLEEQISA
jgi:hypothetical protein